MGIFSLSPSTGNPTGDAGTVISVADAGGANYGRSDKTEQKHIRTYDNASYTGTALVEGTINIKHSAGPREILNVYVATTEAGIASPITGPTTSDITSPAGSRSTTASIDETNQSYWAYGITNTEYIQYMWTTGSGYSAGTISSLSFSQDGTTWVSTGTNTAPSGSTPGRLTPPSASPLWGTNTVYYFKFKVSTSNNKTQLTLSVKNASKNPGTRVISTSSAGVVVSTNEITLGAYIGSPSQTLGVTNTNQSAKLVTSVTDSRYTATVGGTDANNYSLPQSQTSNVTVAAAKSNYNTTTKDGSEYLKGNASVRDCGTIQAKSSDGTVIYGTCSVKQSGGTLSRYSLTVDNTTVAPSQTISKSKSVVVNQSEDVNYFFSSKAFYGNDDPGSNMWLTYENVSSSQHAKATAINNSTGVLTVEFDGQGTSLGSPAVIRLKQYLLNSSGNPTGDPMVYNLSFDIAERHIELPRISILSGSYTTNGSQITATANFEISNEGNVTPEAAAEARRQFIINFNAKAIKMQIAGGEWSWVPSSSTMTALTDNCEFDLGNGHVDGGLGVYMQSTSAYADNYYEMDSRLFTLSRQE